MSLEENIKKWVLLDNNIKQLNDKIKNLKNGKKFVQQKYYTICII